MRGRSGGTNRRRTVPARLCPGVGAQAVPSDKALEDALERRGGGGGGRNPGTEDRLGAVKAGGSGSSRTWPLCRGETAQRWFAGTGLYKPGRGTGRTPLVGGSLPGRQGAAPGSLRARSGSTGQAGREARR